jgi:hypothetical protein
MNMTKWNILHFASLSELLLTTLPYNIVDDEPDVALTFKVGLEGYHYGNHDGNSNKTRFEVYAYSNPLEQKI